MKILNVDSVSMAFVCGIFVTLGKTDFACLLVLVSIYGLLNHIVDKK